MKRPLYSLPGLIMILVTLCVALSMPFPVHAQQRGVYIEKRGNVDFVWINNPDASERAALSAGIDLISVDNKKAIELLTPAAEAGNVNYQYLLAVIYATEAERTKKAANYEKALYWYKECAALGHPKAQFEVGQYYKLAPGDIPHDLNEAIRWYEMAAANPLSMGDAENELAVMYESGKGKPKDEKKAFRYYLQGAQRGNVLAQQSVAIYYFRGKIGAPDIKEAMKWITRAAEQGHAKSQLNLAKAYMKGYVTGAQDPEGFIRWAQKAAENDYIPAMLMLGHFYRQGDGGEIDNVKAAHWYEQAAAQNSPEGLFFFGQMFELGLGVPKDLTRAYFYYARSEGAGFPAAAVSQMQISDKMTPIQLDEAKKRAQAFNAPSLQGANEE